MRFIALEKLINLHDGYRREFRIDYHRLLLLQAGGQLYLLQGTCPHREHPLSEARVGAGSIECPRHRYRFSLSSGELIHFSEEPCKGLQIWPVQYNGADVGVLWEE